MATSTKAAILEEAEDTRGEEYFYYSPYKDFWRRFSKNSAAKAGLAIVLVFLIFGVFADVLAPYDPYRGTANQVYRGQGVYQAPSIYHPMGTDEMGRDIFSRIIYGTRVSLTIGFISQGIATVIGIVLGSLAGYFGGKVDDIIMRTVDLLLIIPTFFLLLLIISLYGPSLINIMVVIGVLGWAGISRMIRAEILSIRQREYVEAAKALGAPDRNIIFSHILPNAISPVIVQAVLGVSGAILYESALSFIGLSDANIVTWGQMLNRAQAHLVSSPPRLWIPIYPGLAIFFLVLAFNMIGDGLRDAIDPKLKER